LGEKKIEPQLNNGKSDDGVYIKYSKTPTSEQLKDLGLNKGPNLAKFTLDDTGETVECRIYLWGYKTKIVVSDIDGTITKTDVFGQLMPALNQTWIHDGVVRMFNKIENNGYEIVYLTARAIVQYEQKRSFLFNFVKESIFI
jgi:phosphatidate phosphatase LPIN